MVSRLARILRAQRQTCDIKVSIGKKTTAIERKGHLSMSFNNLDNLVKMSHRYGADEEFVLAGGGNTSCKENGVLYVKSSGVALSEIQPEQFVAMDIKALHEMIVRKYPANMSESEIDAVVLSDMMSAKLPGEEAKRPSVEAVLHAMFPYKLVLHVHPALINGMTCGADGKAICRELFGEKAVWVDLTKPGLVLAQTCNKIFNAYTEKTGSYPSIVFLQNHGIFVAADTVEEIDRLMGYAVSRLKSHVSEVPDFTASASTYDTDSLQAMTEALKSSYSDKSTVSAIFTANKQVSKFVADKDAFLPLSKPFSPDHIVYCKDEPLFIEPDADISAAFSAYAARKGYKPNIVAVRGIGFFALGETQKTATQARALFLDAIKVATYAKSFGGANPLPDEFTHFIVNWEVEAYRIKV